MWFTLSEVREVLDVMGGLVCVEVVDMVVMRVVKDLSSQYVRASKFSFFSALDQLSSTLFGIGVNLLIKVNTLHSGQLVFYPKLQTKSLL